MIRKAASNFILCRS